ncbi:MAG: ABC transporter permease, partial [Planctomycetes bacterium]|nr:ABC transporter permease [Planctomycetota bacterium]
MSPLRLVVNSLVHYRRTHAATGFGVALATAVLVGALTVGESVRASLRAHARARLGEVDAVVEAGGRPFRAALADDLAAGLGPRLARPIAPVLRLAGCAALPEGGANCPQVQVLGVEPRCAAFSPAYAALARAGPDGVLLNQRLAATLGVGVGATIVLRVERPGLVPVDTPLGGERDLSSALRLTVAGIVAREQLGEFNLRNEPVPPATAFVQLDRVQERAGIPGRANLLLLGEPADATEESAGFAQALRYAIRLEDAGLWLEELPDHGGMTLRSDQIFIDGRRLDPTLGLDHAIASSTYLANELRVSERSASYAFVTGYAPYAGRDLAPPLPGPPLPARIPDDSIVLNEWVAQDLGAEPGDPLYITYFVLGAAGRRVERTAHLVVDSIVPVSGTAADPRWTPEFPGMAAAVECRDWRPGWPIKFERLRPRDEVWWVQRRGTPKAFISLATARRLWENRFGYLTQLRWPPDRRPPDLNALRSSPLWQPGIDVRRVSAEALAATEQGMDFGGLFLGLSAFLIVAALLLTGLLFRFGLEQRAAETGLLLALGYSPRLVRRLLLAEALLPALPAAGLGSALGLGYARLLTAALGGGWSGAVGGTPILFAWSPAPLAGGIAAALVLAALIYVHGLRAATRAPATELLAAAGGGAPAPPPLSAPAAGRISAVAAAIACAGA